MRHIVVIVFNGVGTVLGALFGALLGLTLPLPFDGAAVLVFVGVFGAGLGALGAGILDRQTETDITEEIGTGVEEGKDTLLLLVDYDKMDCTPPLSLWTSGKGVEHLSQPGMGRRSCES